MVDMLSAVALAVEAMAAAAARQQVLALVCSLWVLAAMAWTWSGQIPASLSPGSDTWKETAVPLAFCHVASCIVQHCSVSFCLDMIILYVVFRCLSQKRKLDLFAEHNNTPAGPDLFGDLRLTIVLCPHESDARVQRMPWRFQRRS